MENNKTDEMKKQLENGIHNAMESENFKNWLATCGKLYYNNYSFSNAFLTYLQKSEASYVMGYSSWKLYGRQVTEGAKGIKIFAPRLARETKPGGLFSTIFSQLKKQLKENPEISYATYNLGSSRLTFTMQHNGIMGLQKNGEDVMRFSSHEKCKKFIDQSILNKVPVAFSVVYVFDVSDTYIPEIMFLPKNKCQKEEYALDENGKVVTNRKGEIRCYNTIERQSKLNTDLDMRIPENDKEKMEILFSVLCNISSEKGIPVLLKNPEDDKTLEGGAKGYYTRKDNHIILDSNLSPTEKCSVLFHEMAHSDLHYDLEKINKEMGVTVDRSMREVQAEASAYMTASNFGIDTSTSSFNYLAVWSKGKNLDELEKSLSLIYKESQSLMKSIEKELDNRGLNLQLEPVTISQEKILDTIKEYELFVFDKLKNNGQLFQEARELKDNNIEEALEIIEQQKALINESYNELQGMNQLVNELKESKDYNMQRNIIEKLTAAKKRCSELDKDFALQTDKLVSIYEKIKTNHKLAFSKEPQKVLESLQSKYSELQKLSKNDIKFLSMSKYVAQEFAPELKNERSMPSFINNIIGYSAKAHEVAGDDNTFVEISFCEQWTKDKIFADGTLANAKAANDIIAKAEKNIRKLKTEAEQDGKYFPYNKCNLFVYTFLENDVKAIETIVDIGDGTQIDLKEHLQKVCENHPTPVLDNFLLSLKNTEKARKIEPEIEVKKGFTHKTLTMSKWKEEISQRKNDQQKENEYDINCPHGEDGIERS